MLNKIGEIYTIKDCVADDYGPVFQCKNVGVARRQTRQLLSKALDARDYELYLVADLYFDTDLDKLQFDNHFEKINILVIDEEEKQ